MHAGRGRGRDAAEQAAAEAARQAAMLRHAELVASARKDEGPISIGGMLQILQKLVCGLLEHNQVCRAPRLRLVSRSLWHLLNNFKLRGLLACTLPAEIGQGSFGSGRQAKA